MLKIRNEDREESRNEALTHVTGVNHEVTTEVEGAAKDLAAAFHRTDMVPFVVRLWKVPS